jgi:hypothetical protein
MVNMPKIKKFVAFLGVENVTSESYKFLGLDLNYKTKKGNIQPIMHLYGKHKYMDSVEDGELNLVLFKIKDYDALCNSIANMPEDKLFFKIKPDGKLLALTPELAL